MGTLIKRALLAVPFAVVLMLMFGYASMVAWEPVAHEIVKKVDNKDVKSVELAGHHFQHLAFWTPVLLLALVLVVVGIMLFVSSDKSRLVPGALLGTFVAVVVALTGHKFVPEGADMALMWRGLRFVGVFAVGVALITVYGTIAARIGRDD